MTVGINALSSNDYYTRQIMEEYYKSGVNNNARVQTNVQQPVGDQYVTSNGETCTDGKDDGKIGFFSKLWNAAKGAVKTVVNGVKGMFTDSEGHFSLGKTLLSVATTALCIAVPAVGLVACGVGIVAGGIQVGKGIVKASQATTDAEAKEAWQNIGGGGFTVAMSVAGAKAGIKAVGKTSTAANGLSSLGKDATLGQKAVALGKDMWSSTKNSVSKVYKQLGNTVKSTIKNHKDYKELSALEKQKANILQKQSNGKSITTEEQAILDKWNDLGKSGTKDYSAKAYSKLSQQNEKTFLKATLREARKANDKSAIANTKAALKQYNHDNSLLTKAVNGTKNTINKSNTAKAVNSITNTSSKGIINKINAVRTNLTKANLASIRQSLSADGNAILNALISDSSKYALLVQKYGYENVMEVIKVAGAYNLMNN